MNIFQNKFDIIILSLAINHETFLKTKYCIDSYINTADDIINNIYVIESNPNFKEDYKQNKVEVIIPNEEFNYNKFYNIGLSKCRSEFIAGPNNDLLIKPNCLQTILKEFNDNPDVSSISPIDRNWPRHNSVYFPNDNKLYYGYEVTLHLYGCMIACRRSVFEQIGYLDEQFYFFYQDNDYSMCLQRNNLKHGIHTGAHITHQSGGTDSFAPAKFKYLPENMQTQLKIFQNKWGNTAPFNAGGFQKFKEYSL